MPEAQAVALDFTGVRPFAPMDPGQVYLATITNFKLGISKQKMPKASLELTIEGPEEVQVENWIGDGEDMKADGLKVGDDGAPIMTKASKRKLFREYSLKPEALPFLHETLKAADPDIDLTPKDSKGRDVPFTFDPAKFMGLQVAVKLYNEPYDGVVNARVKRVLPATSYSA